MVKKTVLIGEDEKDIAFLYKTALESAGFDTVVAANGQEVITKAKEAKPDIILLDINMPVMDGFEVLQKSVEDLQLYTALKQVPILMLSNYNNPQDIEYCMKLGVQDYMVKAEWTPKQIVEKVQKYLDKR
jgi:CheY-like chemotaxis protein